MTTRNQTITYRPALGGLDISSDPTTLDPNFLTIADNIEYLEDGRRRKRLGTLPYTASSSTAGTSAGFMVSSGSRVRALGDIWQYGNTLTPTQTLVAVTSASIFRSTGDGNWTAISTTSSFGTNGNVNTCVTQAADLAVISDGVSAPIAFNIGTSALVAATTGSLWPVFHNSVYHLKRLFMSGLSTAPSKVIYSGAGNIFDSTGVDAGNFSLDDGDGDRIVGISEPYFGTLAIFKGPQFGSVFQLSGLIPQAFSVQKITRGAPAVNQRCIITTPTDIFWFSIYGIHSLQTTLKFGDVEQAYLSVPIQRLWRENLIARSDFQFTTAFWNPTRNIVGWFVTPTAASVGAGAGSRIWALVYNYALSDPNPGGKKFWSIWKFPYAITSARMVLNPSGGFQPATVGEPHLYLGSNRGIVYQGDYKIFEDDAGSIESRIRTPTLARLGATPETQEKSFFGVTTYFTDELAATSNYSLSVLVDSRQEIQTFLNDSGSDTLG